MFFYLSVIVYAKTIDGKCGICGDEITSKIFEKGGKHYRGFNVKSYKKTDRIEAIVEVSEQKK